MNKSIFQASKDLVRSMRATLRLLTAGSTVPVIPSSAERRRAGANTRYVLEWVISGLINLAWTES